MGSLFITERFEGSEAEMRVAFKAKCSQDGHEFGHHYSQGNFSDFDNRLVIHNKGFGSEKGASDYIDGIHQKGTPAIAVRILGGPETKASEKQREKLQKDYREANEKFHKIAGDCLVAFQNTKSSLVGCKKCGSRLNRKHLKANLRNTVTCICGGELYSDTILKRLETARTKKIETYKAIESYEPVCTKGVEAWIVGGRVSY